MRPDAAAAERAKEVRNAAKAWRRAGFVNATVVDRVVASYPDDRQRFGPGFRTVAFIFAWMAAWSCMGFFFIPFSLLGSTGWAFMAFLWGVFLTFVTEFQRGPLKRADAGAESATGLMAAGFLLSGAMGLVGAVVGYSGAFEAVVIPTFAALIAGAAAYRWGEKLYFLGAVACVYFLAAQMPFGRALWIALSLALIAVGLRVARSPQHPPPHRTGGAIVASCAIWALYAAVHVFSVDQHLIEELDTFNRSAAAKTLVNALRPLAIVSTAILPLLVIGAGVRRRAAILINHGLLLLGVSVASIRLYHSILPLWLALVLIGALCLGLALGLRRWLRAGDNGERGGFTADPLLDDANRTAVIHAALSAASFTPEAKAAQPGPAFEGGGGGFGGGGATSAF